MTLFTRYQKNTAMFNGDPVCLGRVHAVVYWFVQQFGWGVQYSTLYDENMAQVNIQNIQGDQWYMTMFFGYLVKSDFSGVKYYTRVYWTSHYQINTAMFNWSHCSINL